MARKLPFQIQMPQGRTRQQEREAAIRMTTGRVPMAGAGSEDGDGRYDVTEARLPLANPQVPNNALRSSDFTDTKAQQTDQERIDAKLAEHGTSAREIVNYVLDQQRQMSLRRMLQERDWALSLSFSENNQWLGYDDSTKRLVSLVNEDEKDRYVTADLIGYNVSKLAALCTQSAPDANAAPQTEAPIDVAAAAEARAINAHCDHLFDRQTQTQERVLWSITTTTCWVKTIWDKTARVLVPKIGPDGKVIGSTMSPVGEVDESIVPGFELFCDCSAMKWDDVRTVHHVKLRPVAWAQERFGEIGRAVKGDQRDVTTGYVDAYMYNGGAYGAQAVGPAAVDGSLRWGQTNDSAAYVYERWELSTPRYPKGRYILVMGGQLLDYRDYPYKDREGNAREELPFVPLAWENVAGSPYGSCPVRRAIPLQMAYNRAYSATTELLEAPIATAIIEDGSSVGADAFEWLRRIVRKVYYKRGSTPPVVTTYDGNIMDRERFLDITYQRIQDIFGIHDASNGKVQQGATSGIAINLQQQSDQSHISLFVNRIEKSAVKIREWEIALYEQFAVLPRLLGIADVGDMKQAATNINALRAISDGGQTRVLVRPGSAMPKSAAGQRQEALELFDRGAYGQPGTPQAAMLLMKALSLPQSDQMYDAIAAWDERFQAEQAASQPNPMQEAQVKAQAEAALLQPRTDADIQKAQAESANKIAEIQAQADADIHKETEIRKLPPAIAPITVKGDPAFTLAVEEATPYDAHGAGMHLADLAETDPAHAMAAHGVAPLPPDPMALAEHGANLDIQKQAATQAMTPPEAPEPAEPAPDTEGDHERAKDLITHETEQKMRLAELEAKLAPKPPAKG